MICNEKIDCTGCGACYAICPQHAIAMERDNKGYNYPIISQELCIGCNKCIRSCPIGNKKVEWKKIIQAYVFQNSDETIRNGSTSGGAFSAIATSVLNKGGIVYGAVFDDNWRVIHKAVENIKDLELLRGSKYIQSCPENNYQEIKDKLENNNIVLFSGTTCEVAALMQFLKKEYGNLYTVDFACHGIGSPGFWENYIKYVEKKVGPIKNVFFRNKQLGYAGSVMAFETIDKKLHYIGNYLKFYKKMFFNGNNIRESCFKCSFKSKKRLSDFTLFDCWNINKYEKNWDDDKGTSSILVNTTKAQLLFNEICSDHKFKEVDVDEIIASDGDMIEGYAKENNERDEFWEYYSLHSMDDLIDKYQKEEKNDQIVTIIKVILKKIGILHIIKRRIYK